MNPQLSKTSKNLHTLAFILNLESSTKVCSVSLAENGNTISFREHFGEYAHAEKLTVFARDVIQEAGLTFSDLSAVAVSKGPGSYTGLRIGVSAAKGFAYALDIPLISVPTLQSMAFSAIKKLNVEDKLLCPMIDARRMEVYTAIYDKELNIITDVAAEIIDENSFSEIFEKHSILFFGDGAAKCKAVFEDNPHAYFAEIEPSAVDLAELSFKKFKEQAFEDVAYFEPYYLKEFVTTTPKKLIR
jgi:tRNA threonylcarbamoyladenosine biosynthesis protein TsaB